MDLSHRNVNELKTFIRKYNKHFRIILTGKKKADLIKEINDGMKKTVTDELKKDYNNLAQKKTKEKKPAPKKPPAKKQPPKQPPIKNIQLFLGIMESINKNIKEKNFTTKEQIFKDLGTAINTFEKLTNVYNDIKKKVEGEKLKKLNESYKTIKDFINKKEEKPPPKQPPKKEERSEKRITTKSVGLDVKSELTKFENNNQEEYNKIQNFMKKNEKKNFIYPLELTSFISKPNNEKIFKELKYDAKDIFDFYTLLANDIIENNDLKLKVLRALDKDPKNISVTSKKKLVDSMKKNPDIQGLTQDKLKSTALDVKSEKKILKMDLNQIKQEIDKRQEREKEIQTVVKNMDIPPARGKNKIPIDKLKKSYENLLKIGGKLTGIFEAIKQRLFEFLKEKKITRDEYNKLNKKNNRLDTIINGYMSLSGRYRSILDQSYIDKVTKDIYRKQIETFKK